jgi:hypothetical protein
MDVMAQRSRGRHRPSLLGNPAPVTEASPIFTERSRSITQKPVDQSAPPPSDAHSENETLRAQNRALREKLKYFSTANVENLERNSLEMEKKIEELQGAKEELSSLHSDLQRIRDDEETLRKQNEEFLRSLD